MFRQFSIARFMIGFITFILTYMVAAFSYDNFFKFITAGMFLLSLYIMSEAKKGQVEELARKDAEWQAKVDDVEEQLYRKEAECEFLIQAIIKAEQAKNS
ncbi:hypothetical protein L0657_07230 [Dyadobacter sp. CY345]|uniref:hypothetical protein n=1 Tax=Dyadobacter sp. CY345 TaxID=2909335 RepID=UPI001F2C0ED8|nr:hypothetical protein [Dyadobacter sp. CY345]MCF2443743.1 hypothetical protein [Dyadobacter sp. CY345]